MRKSLILISAADDALREVLKAPLLCYGYQVVESTNSSGVFENLQKDDFDLIILGASLKDAWDVLALAKQIRRSNKEIPLILMAENSSEELAIAALKSGVDDYFKQPFSFEELHSVLSRRLSSVIPTKTSAFCSPTASGLIGGERMIGTSPLLYKTKESILKVAPTNSTVLVTGETGTGKELVAQLIHKNSSRRLRPFICINCAAIPDGLLESELFGHDKGAFTGAHSLQEGKLKLAEAGTVFFDEIGDMSPYAQAKILRTLESKELYRLGGKSTIHTNMRVVAATNQDLERLVEQGKFRKDLFFRLNVARIVVPPLRNRKEDIPHLLAYYIEQFNHLFDQHIEGFEEETIQRLLGHDWPGNVRELKNLLEAIFVNRPPPMVSLRDLPYNFQLRLESSQNMGLSEQERLLSALFSTNWNKSKAAKKLHWSRMTVYRKIAKYQLPKEGNNSGSVIS